MNKRFRCRTHEGGIFSMPARRGRPPVRCTEQHPCDRADQPAQASNRERQLAQSVTRPPESAATGPTGANDSLPLAVRAKAQLEPVGWMCKGRAADQWAELTCSRGAETLLMRWESGVLVKQDYQMEHLRESDNGIPANSLSFNPNEMTDGELVRMVRGMKVTWWNTIASSRETAIVGPNNVAVEHLFVGGGDTDNSKRIVKFLDHGGGGFRAFHVNALLKVG